jgi:hypothetical protein
MQKHELRQIIREEIIKVIKEEEASENVSDYNQTAQAAFNKKTYTLITPEITIEKGDKVLGKYNGYFGVIKKISGNNYFIDYDIDDDDDEMTQLSLVELKEGFLIKKRK